MGPSLPAHRLGHGGEESLRTSQYIRVLFTMLLFEISSLLVLLEAQRSRRSVIGTTTRDLSEGNVLQNQGGMNDRRDCSSPSPIETSIQRSPNRFDSLWSSRSKQRGILSEVVRLHNPEEIQASFGLWC